MISHIKKAILFLLHPKAIIFGVTVFLLIYVNYSERRTMETVGCYDCGWDTRQAFFLLVASLSLFLSRRWCVVLSLLGAMKVIYSVGYVAFGNNVAEAHDGWRILNVSLRWTYETHPEYLAEIVVASVIFVWCAIIIWRHVFSTVFGKA